MYMSLKECGYSVSFRYLGENILRTLFIGILILELE